MHKEFRCSIRLLEESGLKHTLGFHVFYGVVSPGAVILRDLVMIGISVNIVFEPYFKRTRASHSANCRQWIRALPFYVKEEKAL